jgi:hypothetical protein
MDDDDDAPSVPFTGTVRRSQSLEPGNAVLVMDRYDGDIEVGHVLVLTLGETTARVTVATIAWGSSFGYETTPLTLVVRGIDGKTSYAGATLRAEPG